MTQIANDTFTDSHPTNLTSHTSDSGHSWAAATGSGDTLIIDSYSLGGGLAGPYAGVASLTQSATGEAIISVVPANADYTVTVDIYADGSNVYDFPGAMFRAATGADTKYRAYLTSGGSNLVNIALDKIVAGSFTSIGGTSNITVHGSDLLRVSLAGVGTSLTGTLVNVTQSLSTNTTVTDSDITAIGSAGILFQRQSATLFANAIVAFSVDGTAGGGPTPNPFLLRSIRVSPRRR